MRQLLFVVIPALALGCGGTSSDGGNGGGGGGPPQSSLVSGLSVTDISIYQGIKVPLASNGVAVDPRPVPVVQGRDALLRVFVQPEPSWQPREVIVRLELGTPNGELPAQEIRRVVSGGSSEGDFMSAFNFDIPGDQITGDLGYSVGIYEVSPSSAAPSAGARFPQAGKIFLGAGNAGPALKMVLVPIRWDADGSGRLPDLSEQQIERYRSTMYRLYPTPKVDIRIRDPLPWNKAVSAFGQGWGSLLQNILYWRENDISKNEAAQDEYYYGAFMPTSSFFSYCQQGCVAGLSSGSVNPKDTFLRGSIGLGYPGEHSAGTFTHEIGHAHGRLHAPCAPGGQIQGIDPGYPHANATLGSWGYDLVDHVLVDPGGKSRDMMSYCEPSWVSDYTFAALFDRIAVVNGVQDFHAVVQPTKYRVISVDGDGELAQGVELKVSGIPGGEPTNVEIVTSAGKARGVTGYFYPYSHIPGGMVLVPSLTSHDVKVRVAGRDLFL